MDFELATGIALPGSAKRLAGSDGKHTRRGAAHVVQSVWTLLRQLTVPCNMISIKSTCQNSGPDTLAKRVAARAFGQTEQNSYRFPAQAIRKRRLKPCVDTGLRPNALNFHSRVPRIPPPYLLVNALFSSLIISVASSPKINRIAFLLLMTPLGFVAPFQGSHFLHRLAFCVGLYFLRSPRACRNPSCVGPNSWQCPACSLSLACKLLPIL